MRELSLNVLDIAQNSIAAGAQQIDLLVREDTAKKTMLIGIYDNGHGMTREQAEQVLDPFYTTRTTRKVGMGIPLFKLAAEQTGGGLTITSVPGEGTRVEALFHTDSVDFTPLGDIASTVAMLASMNEDRDFTYTRAVDDKSFVFSSAEVKTVLDGVPLSEPSVIRWMESTVNEQTEELYHNNEGKSD